MIAPAFKRTVAGTSRPVLGAATRAGRRARFQIALGTVVYALSGRAEAASDAPRTTEHYLQYGVAFATEFVASPGSVCPAEATAPCILGSGVGLTVRFGYRTRGPFYVGGAYEFSRQDASNLLRLAILQQLRGEARYYMLEDTRLTPYLAAAAGGVLYGNEWGVDTGGITMFLGMGVEFQISRTSVVGASLGYRPVAFRHWEDGAGQVRADALFGFGVSHLIGAELVFEVRDPLPRW
jgi:hypothetical protein